jgi:hypothetical protein
VITICDHLKNLKYAKALPNAFTPLESPSIYAGDGRNRKHQLLIEGRVKALLFLTGFTEHGTIMAAKRF